MHSSKVKEISLIGILAAVNIASRIYLQFLPNIKPVTSIIIICSYVIWFRIWCEVKCCYNSSF